MNRRQRMTTCYRWDARTKDNTCLLKQAIAEALELFYKRRESDHDSLRYETS